jgi:octaprenyl-diphosphate synthase
MHHFERIVDAMNKSGSIEYTQKLAELEANKAKAAIRILPESNYKQALMGLADISINRDS